MTAARTALPQKKVAQALLPVSSAAPAPERVALTTPHPEPKPWRRSQTRNGLRRHPDLPRVWVSKEFLSTEEVWPYLLQKPNPRDNRPLYKLSACCRAEWHSAQAERCSALRAGASNGECPTQIDTSTPSCGNPAQRDWTCTVVDRDKARSADPFVRSAVLQTRNEPQTWRSGLRYPASPISFPMRHLWPSSI